MYIRQNKTDSRDSFIIAEVLRFGKYSTARVPQDKILALREMCRNRYFMIDSVSDLKRKVTALIDQIFPEYETLFCDIFGITSMQLLTKYPSPEKIHLAKPSSITNLLLKASNGRFGQAKMLEVKELAKNTFGVEDTNGVYSDLIQCYMEQIKFIHQQINVLDLKIKAISDTIDSHITSIPGIGPILGATILAEIGDISRFSSSDKLAAFAGVDPTVKQSGDFVGVKNHMSKRGTPYLRRALWMASTIAVRFDPMFRAYHEKKAAEGMRYMKIMGHVTKKMTAVIFAVLRENKEYKPVLQTAESA